MPTHGFGLAFSKRIVTLGKIILYPRWSWSKTSHIIPHCSVAPRFTEQTLHSSSRYITVKCFVLVNVRYSLKWQINLSIDINNHVKCYTNQFQWYNLTCNLESEALVRCSAAELLAFLARFLQQQEVPLATLQATCAVQTIVMGLKK